MKIKVENKKFIGEIELPFCDTTVTRVDFDHDLKLTDEQYTNMLIEIQEKMFKYEKCLRDRLIAGAIKKIQRVGYIFVLEYCGVDDIEYTFHGEALEQFDEYIEETNLFTDAENYTGDLEKLVKELFPNVEYNTYVSHFELDALRFHGDGYYSICPYNTDLQEIWESDYISFDINLNIKIE